MGKLISLDEVNASVLPAKVLVLLSKYAQSMRKHTGLVIKISSMNVFKHVHNTNKLTEHPEVRRLHRDLLVEVNHHLLEGTMQTNRQRYEATEFPVTQRFKSESLGSVKPSGEVSSRKFDIENSLSVF